MEARFGSGEALVRLSEMTVKQEGFGKKMALGTARLAKMLGPKAERIAVTVKGKEFPAHMPTAKASMGLIYAVNPFGPDHVSTTHDGDIAAEPNEVNKGVGIYETAKVSELDFAKTKMVAYSQRYVSAHRFLVGLPVHIPRLDDLHAPGAGGCHQLGHGLELHST